MAEVVTCAFTPIAAKTSISVKITLIPFNIIVSNWFLKNVIFLKTLAKVRKNICKSITILLHFLRNYSEAERCII